jgi:hypothetical protein
MFGAASAGTTAPGGSGSLVWAATVAALPCHDSRAALTRDAPMSIATSGEAARNREPVIRRTSPC